MKIGCYCGATIVDQTDGHSDKAHFFPDQVWDSFFDALDVLAKAGPSPAEQRAAWKPLRHLLATKVRLMWQCRACGRLYIDDQEHNLQNFVPSSDATPKEMLSCDEGSTSKD
jgi:hypothetical protein